MSVPKSAYSFETIEDKLGEGGTHNVYALMPLLLNEYRPNPSAPVEETSETDLAAFRLDFFLDETWNRWDSNGNRCPVGMVKYGVNETDYTQNRTNNWFLHNPARISRLCVAKNGIRYQLLNDGGLHTMPYAEFSGNILAAYPNFVKVLCNLRSAYYIDSDCFTIRMYRTRDGVKTELYDFPINVGTDDEPTPELPAKGTKTQYPVKYRGTIGGLEEGDLLTLEISATNSEGTFTNAVTKSAKVLAAMTFIQIYRHPELDSHTTGTAIPDTIEPTDGTPYAMLISQDMYDEGQMVGGIAVAGTGGVLYRLFEETGGGDPMAGTIDDSERLQGAAGSVEDAYEAALSYLPAGYYYGVPTSWNGSTQAYVQVVNSNSLRWYPNQHTSADFTITMSLTGVYNVMYDKYYVYVWCKATGVLPSGGVSVSTEVHEMTFPHSAATKIASVGPVTVSSTVKICLNPENPIEVPSAMPLATDNTSAYGAREINEGTLQSTDYMPDDR